MIKIYRNVWKRKWHHYVSIAAYSAATFSTAAVRIFPCPNANQLIYHFTKTGLKIYQSAISPLIEPLYDRNPENVNLLHNILKYRSEYQELNLGNWYILNKPSRTNSNTTTDMVFNNIQIKRGYTNQWVSNNAVN